MKICAIYTGDINGTFLLGSRVVHDDGSSTQTECKTVTTREEVEAFVVANRDAEKWLFDDGNIEASIDRFLTPREMREI